MRRARWVAVPLLVIPLGWILFTGLGRDPAEIPSPLIGKPMPAFVLTGLDGGVLDSADLAGRPLIVNFWASWCIPACVDEHPVLMELAARRWRADFEPQIVGILYDDTPADALAFLARYGDGGWPNLDDPTGEVALAFGVLAPPETFFVDADGIVRAKHYGPLTFEDVDRYLALLEGGP